MNNTSDSSGASASSSSWEEESSGELSDQSLFSSGQQGAFSVVIPFAMCMGFVIWRVAKRKYRGNEREYDRLGVWYWAVAGAVCGKWLFHALPNATLHTTLNSGAAQTLYSPYGVIAFGVFIGMFIMVAIQEVGRVWHENHNYVSSPYVEAQEDMLDRHTVTKQNNVRIDDMSDFSENVQTAYDKIKDQTRRRRVARILLLCMFYLASLEGIFTCYWQDKTPAGLWAMVIMSWVMRMLDSLIVYGAMIHGMFHEDERAHWWQWFTGYGALSCYWSLTQLLSMVPVFIGMTPAHAEAIISHTAFALFCGIAAGILIWYWAYFMFMQPRHVIKRYTKWRLSVFLLLGLLSGAASLFV